MANILRNAFDLVRDAFGRSPDKAKLLTEISGPTTTGTRSILAGHPADGMTPQRLGGLLRSAEAGDARAYLELAEQMEEKDLHYLGVLGQRKRGVAQLEISVEAAGDDADAQADADLIRDWLNRDTLEDELFDLFDAIGKGFSLVEMIWETSERQWWPGRLQWVDPRWVEFDRIDGRTPKLIGADGLAAPLEPFKYIYTEIKAKSGLPIRGGLARPVSWAWMFKNYGVKDWVAFAETYGMPLRLGKYDGTATAEDRKILLRAVRELGSDAAGIIPKTMSVDFITAAGNADGAVFERQADWFDRQISKAVLGQTMTTDAQSAGLGSNQSKVQDGVRADIERADAKAGAAALNIGLVRPMIDLNRGRPKGGRYPRILIGRAEAWDASKMMPVVERFVALGGRVEESVIRDRIGLPDPGESARLLQPAQSPAAAPQNAITGPDGNSPAKTASDGFLGRLNLLKATAATDDRGASVDPDAIGRFVDTELDDWQMLVDPITDPLIALAGTATSLDDLRDRLTGELSRMDTRALVDLLARSAFAARLAGAAGVGIGPAGTDDNA